MSFYRLTHIDGEPLPVRLPVGGAEYVITGGSFRFEPPTELDAALGAAGSLHWDLQGYRPPAARPAEVRMARHHHRRLDSRRVQFPFDRPGVPAEYTAEVAGGALTVRSRTEVDREHSPARTFGGDREWRFAAAPGEDPGPRWRAHAGPVLGAVHVSIGGREVPWLGRLLTRLLGPICDWRERRRLRRRLRHRGPGATEMMDNPVSRDDG